MPVKLTIFLAVFCYIGALVCAVLVVRNAVEVPPETNLAFVFGVVGVIMLLGGVLLSRGKYFR